MRSADPVSPLAQSSRSPLCRAILLAGGLASFRASNGPFERMVVGLPIDERESTCRGANRAHPADDDGVIAVRKHFRNLAIKSGESILQDRSARQHGRPSSALKSSSPFKAISSGKPVRNRALFVAQQVHAEIGMPLKRTPGSRVLGNANQQSWRARAQRSDLSGGESRKITFPAHPTPPPPPPPPPPSPP